MDRSLALLGIAKKAGLLAVGGQAAGIAARRGEAKLIITASDASEGSVRRAKLNAQACGAKYLAVPLTMFELGRTSGRGSPATIAFLDKGLADGFLSRIETAGSMKTEIPINTPAELKQQQSTKESDA